MSTTPAESTPPAKSAWPRFVKIFVAGVKRLLRPVRPMATPALVLFPTWTRWAIAVVAGLVVVALGMIYVDPPIQIAQHAITGGLATFFEWLTDVGKSGWLLWPTGLAILLILAVVPPARTFADRVVLALCARLAFVFVAVGGSGLIITIVKRIIGRARPRFFEEFGALHFDVMAWKASFASFPSGHSQSAFAIAVAFACLAPRWRWPLLIVAASVAVSRVIVDAHYFTDIVVGSMWGAWFTIMTRDWFARRGLVFSPTASRAPFPMPARRIKGAIATLHGCLWPARVLPPKANS